MSASSSDVLPGADGKPRCFWAAEAPEMSAYHDREWGFPVRDDARLFEKLCLEGFQAGLSWRTILAKREAFRAAFAGFDHETLARWGDRQVEKLLKDGGIVRHRGKIASALHNARCVRALIAQEGSLARFVWRYEPARRPARITKAYLCANTTSPESVALSKELKRRGFTFVGPTTVYAFMQAMGLVNDHVEGCFVRPAAEKARKVSPA